MGGVKMKNLKIKLLTLGILTTVVTTSTPAFAATNISKAVTAKKIVTINANSVSKTLTIPNTIKASWSYSPNGGPTAQSIINSGGVIQEGDVGEAVKEVQQKLANMSLLNQSEVDGYFGPITYDAVREYQTMIDRRHDGDLATDGIVGSQTWSYLAP
jgi:peptidoglycan hydrolase-like protein with peptidoglycan-binding domain